LSMPGLLRGPEADEIILSDETGGMIGMLSEPTARINQTIAPLAAFTLQSKYPFNRISFVQPSSLEGGELTIFPQPIWSEVYNRWDSNQNLKVELSNKVFRGLVWKETFSHNWNVLGTDGTGRVVPLQYLMAGPGLAFVPLSGNVLVSVEMS